VLLLLRAWVKKLLLFFGMGFIVSQDVVIWFWIYGGTGFEPWIVTIVVLGGGFRVCGFNLKRGQI